MIWGQRVLFGCLVVVDDRVASFFWKHRLAGLPLVGHSKKSYLYTGLENTVCLFESINGLTALTVSHVKSPGDKYIVLAPSKLKQVELLSSAPPKKFWKYFIHLALYAALPLWNTLQVCAVNTSWLEFFVARISSGSSPAKLIQTSRAGVASAQGQDDDGNQRTKHHSEMKLFPLTPFAKWHVRCAHFGVVLLSNCDWSAVSAKNEAQATTQQGWGETV